jgi:putative aldouronate transport system permease protein
METTKKKKTLHEVWKARYLYILLLPLLVWLAVFCYAPMYGVLLAFKNYNAKLGIMGSPWVGLQHFQRIFITPDAIRSIRNTVIISLGRLIFEFPMPIIMAIMITEMPGNRAKKIYQTVFTFPHFLSWVVVANIVTNFLAQGGAVNILLDNMGLSKIDFLTTKSIFRPFLYVTSNWKEMGWSAIIYMAAIAGIDTTLYEAARVDGATRLKQIWHVTLPGILSTIVIMFILQVGGMMNAGFDQVFNLRNDVVKSVSQILDTYVYDITFLSTPNYGFSTAVGLFKSVINFFLLFLANTVTKKISGQGMFA